MENSKFTDLLKQYKAKMDEGITPLSDEDAAQVSGGGGGLFIRFAQSTGSFFRRLVYDLLGPIPCGLQNLIRLLPRLIYHLTGDRPCREQDIADFRLLFRAQTHLFFFLCDGFL